MAEAVPQAGNTLRGDRVPWSEADKETVRALWISGKSAAFIADKFKSTRSAVCGLANRQGWITPNAPSLRPKKTPRLVPFNVTKASRRASSPTPQPPMEPDPEPTVDDLAIPLEQRRTLLQLGPGHCRWPVGSPGDGLFFCGAVPLEERSYCAAHYRRSIQPPSRRRPHSFSLAK